MERMSEKELEKLRELQAKAKRVERQEKEFFATVDERRDEVLDHLNVDEMTDDVREFFNDGSDAYNRLLSIANNMYGVSVDELLEYISSDSQVDYFKRTHQTTLFDNGGWQ